MTRIDAGQLSIWYDRWCGRLVLYARGWLAAGQAEDVVQDVFIRLMGQRSEPGNVKAWLFRCVRNEAMSQLRRRTRHKKYQHQVAVEQRRGDRSGWFESKADDLIDARLVQSILETLAPDKREVIMLRIWGQMTLREVAEILGSPLSTVHSRYQAGLSAMKSKLELSCKTKNT